MHTGVEAHFRPEGIEPEDSRASTVFNYERRILDAIDYGVVVDVSNSHSRGCQFQVSLGRELSQ